MGASLKLPKTAIQIKNMSAASLRKEYLELKAEMERLLNCEVIICPECGNAYVKGSFYKSISYSQGYYPVCKQCTLMEVEQREFPEDEPKETKDSIKQVLRKMDLPYIDELYDKLYEQKEKGELSSVFSRYVTMMASLPQYRGLHYKDSVFEDASKLVDGIDVSVENEAVRRFGEGYTKSDYAILQGEYNDWVTRYECQTKAQEEIFTALSINKLARMKAAKQGKPTKDLDRTMQDLLSSGDILPKKNAASNFTESKTFGTLIQEWENEDPIPEPEEEFKDVDKIGLYLDVFFKGHLSRTLHLANPLASIYEKYIKKYTVNKPEYTEEDEDIDDTFLKLFGDVEDE